MKEIIQGLLTMIICNRRVGTVCIVLSGKYICQNVFFLKYYQTFMHSSDRNCLYFLFLKHFDKDPLLTIMNTIMNMS